MEGEVIQDRMSSGKHKKRIAIETHHRTTEGEARQVEPQQEKVRM